MSDATRRNLEGWLQAILPMLVVLATISYNLGGMNEKLDSLDKRISYLETASVKRDGLIRDAIHPVKRGMEDNTYAIVVLSKDVEVLYERSKTTNNPTTTN